jgi:hypothetical protein
LTEALDRAGIAAQINAGQLYVRRHTMADGDPTTTGPAANGPAADTGADGPT